MAKVQSAVFVLFFLLMSVIAPAQKKYKLFVEPVDKSPSFAEGLKLQSDFSDSVSAINYLNQIVPILNAAGYIAASVDSAYFLPGAVLKAKVYVGEQYRWKKINIDEPVRKLLAEAGFNEKEFTNSGFRPDEFRVVQEKMLYYFETSGHPFASLRFDSIRIENNEVSGYLKAEPGPLYHVDSIKVVGNAKLSNDYLQRFLNIKNGSAYNREKLERISTELKKLNYVEEMLPPKFYWGSTGGTVELYLKEKKSNRVNFIIGFLPNNDQLASKKMLVTGEGLLNLQNALGTGETIGLVWQKLQVASQRLDIIFGEPYLFRSPFGLDFGFDMMKKDSSFLNADLRLGTRYTINAGHSLALFFQQTNAVVSNIDAKYILQYKQLPIDADMKNSKIGLEYNFVNTNYIYNPIKGNELNILFFAGYRKIRPNAQIIELNDENDPDFDFKTLYDTIKLKTIQIRLLANAAKYFPFSQSNRNTLKTALNLGYLSGGNLYRNELFQIGGYRLLRGFDEQSQYLSRYAIATLEYRYLVSQNSYFNVFTDGGWGANDTKNINRSYTFLGMGLGMAFETKAGIFNLSWAIGKRNDTNFNLRQSKIHFGFINYF